MTGEGGGGTASILSEVVLNIFREVKIVNTG